MAEFWNALSVEPKRKNRFLMSIHGNGVAVDQWIVKATGRPGLTISETEHKFLNHTFYFPGSVTYDTIDVTLVDPLHPDATGKILQILNNAGYRTPADQHANQGSGLITKAGASLGMVKIQSLGYPGISGQSQIVDGPGATEATRGTPKPQPVESWELKNVWIQAAKFGDMAYDSEDIMEITLTLRYDYALFSTVDSTSQPSMGPGGFAQGTSL